MLKTKKNKVWYSQQILIYNLHGYYFINWYDK